MKELKERKNPEKLTGNNGFLSQDPQLRWGKDESKEFKEKNIT